MNARVLFLAALAAPLMITSGARAGQSTTSLSTLHVMLAPTPIKLADPPVPVPGLELKSKDGYGATRWHDVTVATHRGYCLAANDGGFRWMASYGSGSRSPSEDLDLFRLVEKDGGASLEKTRVHFDPPSATLTATARSTVPLTEVARSAEGIVVWAYRDGREVVVLARKVDRGMESTRRMIDDQPMFPFVSSDCPFAGARLDARKPEIGSFVQLVGNLPAKGTGKDKVVPRFMIDASLVRISRDPEPTLSIRVRTS
ncbi:MAG: hypothetical protein KF819_01260 [Labilithrix sp.]|nr:hypothetical protein [Labilithrix sp.]